jgi:NAD-dependent dihydropyrimidine dehydrogenase PreA subunit
MTMKAIWNTLIPTVDTLVYDEALCIGCGMCVAVCPHGVFALQGKVARVVRREDCIECGACDRNCPVDAIQVDSGVGCAAAMIYAALTGRETPTCGPTCSPNATRGGRKAGGCC